MGNRGHIPIRMCIGCRTRKPKKELIRLIKKLDGSIVYDKKGNIPGRGFYICKDIDCIKKAKKREKELSYYSLNI